MKQKFFYASPTDMCVRFTFVVTFSMCVHSVISTIWHLHTTWIIRRVGPFHLINWNNFSLVFTWKYDIWRTKRFIFWSLFVSSLRYAKYIKLLIAKDICSVRPTLKSSKQRHNRKWPNLKLTETLFFSWLDVVLHHYKVNASF